MSERLKPSDDKPITPVRRLAPDDLDGTVAIDRAIVGHSRRGYFEKRLAAALRDPEMHVQFGIDGSEGLEAVLLARVLSGEFGHETMAVVLEVIDVAPACRHLGHGATLLAALEGEMRRRGIEALQTSIVWTDHAMAKFLGDNNFVKAQRHIIAGAVDRLGEMGDGSSLADDLDDTDDPDRADGVEALPSGAIEVASLEKQDLGALVRIDRKLTGRDRRDYIAAKVDEALLDSGIRVSLVARSDDIVVGFLMARLDFGDFGRAAPVAVIDTVGVHPDFARHGVARALLAQLLINL
ncbi:MAG: GNAT family N-acetyltransferase [Alphaproteobacteria bacterium]|nr:GNAT family N-acetyltransferase [Alphaproteobacteria bacterium]